MRLNGIHDMIASDGSLSRLFEAARTQAQGDAAHDVGHCLRVAELTVRIGRPLGVSPRLAIAAALLHDAVNVPKNSPDRARASELSAEFASRKLEELGFDRSEREAVATAVRQHSFSRGEKPTEPLAMALQDADRLEAVGAIGVFRVVSTGAKMGAGYFDAEDPWAADRELDDRRYSVDHFFTKLLGLPETMNTAEGRAEGLRRTEFMRGFLRQLGEELGREYRERAR